MAVLGGVLVLIVVLAAAFGPAVYSRDPNFQSVDGMTLEGDPLGPSTLFPLGTDASGRDELARVLSGARVSLEAAVFSNGLAALIGLLVGGFAGVGGRVLQQVLMRSMDVVLSFPVLLMAMVFLAIARPSMVSVAIIIGLGWGAYLSRIVFGIVQSLAAGDMTASAVAIGASRLRILFRHLLPHAFPAVIVYVTLGIGVAIQAEAVFGYIGVGIQPPAPSWGNMIAEGQGYILTQPRLVLIPAVAIMLAMLGFALLGDALRQVLDPTSEVDERTLEKRRP